MRNFDEVDARGNTLPHVVAHSSDAELVKPLLGAPGTRSVVKNADRYGRTPLTVANEGWTYDDDSLKQMLIDAGATHISHRQRNASKRFEHQSAG